MDNLNSHWEDGPDRPIVYGEIVLYFDEDIEPEVISGIIGVKPDYERKKTEALAIPSPFGLWVYKTVEYGDCDCRKAIEDLHTFIATKEKNLLTVMSEYKCNSVLLTLVIKGTSDRTFPGTTLPKEFLEDAIRLHADIDIDIY